MQRVAALGSAVLVLSAAAFASAQNRRPRRVAEKAIAEAAAQLVGPDEKAAISAAALLGSVPNRTATAPLTAALSLGLTGPVASAALGALGQRGDVAALPILEYYSKVRPRLLREAAARALARFSSERASKALIAALSDPTKSVRAAAATALATRKTAAAVPALLALLARGELPAAQALGALGDAEVARQVAELIGQAPDVAVAEALGGMLLRADFGPDSLRVEVVRALAKIPGDAGIEKLATYVAETPEKPPRGSRREAEAIVTQRL